MRDLTEVAPPGWGHTKAEKEKTKPNKPKSKIGGTIAAMKRAQGEGRIPKKLNIFALAYSMKNKGAKPHYKPGTDKKYKKYQEEDAKYGYDKKGRSLNPKDIKKRNKQAEDKYEPNKPAIEDWVSGHSMGPTEGYIPETMSGKDAKKLDKASSLAQSKNPDDWMRSSARWTEVSVKDLKKQRKSGKVGVGKSMREGRSWKEWKTAAKAALGRKTPKHDYGKDAGAEAARRLRKRDHEKVNFLDPED